MENIDTPRNRWLLNQRHAQRQATRLGIAMTPAADNGASNATALAQVIRLDHVLTPAYPQRPTPLCACGQPASAYIHGIPMCGRCALAAMQQTGR